jgi:hypothetical protein
MFGWIETGQNQLIASEAIDCRGNLETFLGKKPEGYFAGGGSVVAHSFVDTAHLLWLNRAITRYRPNN